MSKFKVGDIIKRKGFIIGNSWDKAMEKEGHKPGKEVMVIEATDMDIKLSCDGTEIKYNNCTWYANYFELSEEFGIKHKFNIGDKIMVLNTPDNRSCSTIKDFIGKICTVKEYLDTTLYVEEFKSNWCDYRFKLVKGKSTFFHDGQKIICMNSKDKFLTEGKEYTVCAIQPYGKIDIINDKGIKCLHHERRFRPKESLIKNNMDIDEIAGFPKNVLVAAEKLAKDYLAEDQVKIATAKFKELFVQISDAEKEVETAQKKLNDLRGKIKTVTPKKGK